MKLEDRERKRRKKKRRKRKGKRRGKRRSRWKMRRKNLLLQRQGSLHPRGPVPPFGMEGLPQACSVVVLELEA